MRPSYLITTVKFIYSEKATNFCKIFTVDFSHVLPVKSTVEISQNFVIFSEYMNFKIKKALVCLTLCFDKSYYEYFPSKIFRISLQWPSMNFVWNALRSINHNILWIIFLWSTLDFFNYLRSKKLSVKSRKMLKNWSWPYNFFFLFWM